jgi:hypothetical protein
MTTNNLDSLANIEYFLAKLTKLSCETGIQVGDNSPTNPYIVHNNKLKGRYTLENSTCFGFKHDKYQKGA